MNLVYRVEFLKPGHGVRLEWGVFTHEDQVRDHGTFCRIFKLDPVRSRIEMGKNLETGFVFFSGEDGPIAKVERARHGERFRDLEPFNRRDFESFRTTY